MSRTRRKKQPTLTQEVMGGLADGLLLALVFFAVIYATSWGVQRFGTFIDGYVAQYERKATWGF